MSEPETLPRRPRRRLITPWTLGLGAVLVAALGFIGGVQVQRGQASTASGSTPTAFTRGGAGGGGFPGGGFGQGDGGSAPVIGTVADKSGRTLYVKTNDGTTIRVKPASSVKVSRNAKSSVRAVHPGDTVVVTGKQAKNGTVTAGQITATAKGASGGGFGGGFGGFGGGNSQGSPSQTGNAGGG